MSFRQRVAHADSQLLGGLLSATRSKGLEFRSRASRLNELREERKLQAAGRSVARRHTLVAWGAAEELKRLCDLHGSDKGSMRELEMETGHPPHSYCDIYGTLFDHCRESVRTVFECGIGTSDPSKPSTMGALGRPGASLRVWRDYFPHAQIIGADIDRNTLFAEERIRTYQVDQTSAPSVQNLWDSLSGLHFDLFIDDGLHTFAAAKCLFDNSWDRLKPGGLYVVEDLWMQDLAQFVGHVQQLGLPTLVARALRPGRVAVSDNSLVIVRKPTDL